VAVEASNGGNPIHPQEGTTRAASTHEAGIPRLIYLGRTLSLCFYPLTAVLLGDAVLLFVPQASEALLAFGDDGQFAGQAVAFEIAFVLWMISAWYVARLLVGRRFDPDLIGKCRKPGFAVVVTKWLPRTIALLAGPPLAVRITLRGESGWLGPILILSSLLVLLGLAFRRKIAEQRHYKWLDSWRQEANEDVERFDEISASGKCFLVVLAIVGVTLWLAIPIFMEPLTRALGTPAILLLALMSWSVFGGFMITYWPKSLHLTAWSWILILLALIFYPINENHLVTDGLSGKQQVPNAPDPANPRQKIDVAFNSWLARRIDPDAPVIFVASAGGASRAAYWTASALGKLEGDLTSSEPTPDKPSQSRFSRNVFAISSISGGSLGAAAFVSAVAEHQLHPTDTQAAGRSARAVDGCPSVRTIATNFTGRDHLATVVGLMLFPDLIDRFLFFPLHAWDRSRGLEEVWARDWVRVQQDCFGPSDAVHANPWDSPFLQLHYSANTGVWLPMLALNSTALDAGRPVLQADFILYRSDAFDLLSGQFATGNLTLSQAVHNSARFPYVSPGGQVKLWDQAQNKAGPVWDRLGDGGYVEASGTLTLAEMIRELRKDNLIRPGVAHGECAVTNGSKSCFIAENQLKVVVLDNSPSKPMDWLCKVSSKENSTAARDFFPQGNPEGSKPFLPVIPDLTVPMDGAFSTRGGRAVTSQVDLLELMGGCTDQFAELRLPKPAVGKTEPSMNWMLNKQSRDQIDAVLDDPSGLDPSGLLADNLRRVRDWFGVSVAVTH
jgi:hypothetical protein